LSATNFANFMTEPVCLIPDWRGKHLIIRGEGKCLKQDSPQKTMKSIYIYIHDVH
jgi:hypothetical protein